MSHTKIACVAFSREQAEPTVVLLDQRRLPSEEIWHRYTDPEDVALGISDMIVRGAPAIGVTAGYGIALGMSVALSRGELAGEPAFSACLQGLSARFAATRPTAVNLFWAIDRLQRRAERDAALSVSDRVEGLVDEALTIHAEDRAACVAMGEHGRRLLPESGGVLTHCNTGALATGGQGTALGVIRSAVAAGADLHVWVDETRPYLQGARLTAWECVTDGIPATLITDNMAAWMMKKGRIKAAIVGSDRIAANGDVANKIGTYGVAVLCRHHGIPFYVAAPTSTIDLDCPTGEEIPIEQRTTREVTHLGGWLPVGERDELAIAPADVAVLNPAFDVVPAELVTAIITERGVANPPFVTPLAQMVRWARAMDKA